MDISSIRCWIIGLSLALPLYLPFVLAAPPPPRGPKILVPAYFYPGGKELDTWHKLIAAGAKTQIIAIANPASGPNAWL